MKIFHPHRPILFTLTLAAFTVAGCSDNEPAQAPTTVDVSGDAGALEHWSGWHGHATEPFGDAQIYIEFNSTDNDAGIQVFLDAEDWKAVSILDERGRELLEIETGGGMRELGLTELRFEGAEPDPSEVLEAFPPGEYAFRGRTVERQRLASSAFLSHDIPAAPSFTPSGGEVVDPDNVVIEWDPIPGVARYQVIVESDDFEVSMTVDVLPAITNLHVPPTFLVPDTEYKVEVLAIAPSGNRTITEGTFVTGP